MPLLTPSEIDVLSVIATSIGKSMCRGVEGIRDTSESTTKKPLFPVMDTIKWTPRRRVCKWCGIEAPRAHWRPYTWTEYHELSCPKNPANQKGINKPTTEDSNGKGNG